MIKPLFYLLPILLLLQACATTDHAPITDPQETTRALTLKSYSGYANVYIRRDDASQGSTSGMNIKINNQSIGKLRKDSYFNVKIIPGTYTINTYWDEHNLQTAAFTQKFKAGEVSLIQCTWGIMLGHEKKKNVLASRPYGVHLQYPCWYETEPSLIRTTLKNNNLLSASQSVYSPIGYTEFDQVKKKHTIESYQSFIANFPTTPYTKNAQTSLNQLKEQKRNENWSKLSKQQQCTLHHNDWLYIDNNCSNKIANGKGRAVYIDTRHSFDGIIENGLFVSGKYLLDGKMLFDGQFENAIPNGKGICLYEDALEECKYYNGERIDSLYKQRLTLSNMEKRQQLELSKIRDEISDLKSQRSQQVHSGNSNDVGDLLLDKAIDKGMGKLFDSLF